MAPPRFWTEGMEQASPDRAVDGQLAIVTLTVNRIAQYSRNGLEFLLVATKHEGNDYKTSPR